MMQNTDVKLITPLRRGLFLQYPSSFPLYANTRWNAYHRRINESLFALALVEPTQYVTQDVNIPDTCPAM